MGTVSIKGERKLEVGERSRHTQAEFTDYDSPEGKKVVQESEEVAGKTK